MPNHQPKPLSVRDFTMFTDPSFELDTSLFTLSPEARMALQNLRVSYMIDKVNTNSLGYIADPEKLAQALIRGDIAITLFDSLLELDTANRYPTTLENTNEPE